MPNSLAKSTASEEGAETAAKNGIFALKHLIIILKIL